MRHDEPAAGSHVELGHLRLICVAGADRASFLQGQLTQDINQVDPARSALYGWTTAQGRLLVTGQVFTWHDAFWLTAPAATAEALARRLRMFVLRARVTVEVAGAALLGWWRGDAASLDDVVLPAAPLACAGGARLCGLRLGGDPGRVLVATTGPVEELRAAMGATAADDAAWGLADVRAGLPCIGEHTGDRFIPQMVNLDLLGAIAFDKGCYVGQEIITRTRHLGRIKRRMLRFACPAGATLAAGDPIFADGHDAGTVVCRASAPNGEELLVVTRLDTLPGPLYADAEARSALLRLELPYRIPEADAAPRP